MPTNAVLPGRLRDCPRALLRSRLGAFPLLAQPCGLPAPLPQVVELGPIHLVAFHQVDLADDRRMQREDAFHADASRDLPDRERGAVLARMPRDHDSLERLDA